MSNPLQGVPDNSDAARIAALEASNAALARAVSGAGAQIGDYVYTSIVPANWNTPGTVILSQGNRMVPNGVNISRTDFPDLNAAYAAIGYPFGTGDGSTTFGTPDVLGRAVWCIGTHSDVNALNDNDGIAFANRTPKHNSSGGGTFVTGGGSVTVTTLAGQQGTGAGVSYGNPGSFSVTGQTTGSVSVGPGGTRPIDMPSYIVAGIWLLVVLP